MVLKLLVRASQRTEEKKRTRDSEQYACFSYSWLSIEIHSGFADLPGKKYE